MIVSAELPDFHMPVIAYLINQYPSPSHTFIRREIAALEKIGWTVHRVSHRAPRASLVDAADRAEADRTHLLLGQGLTSLLVAAVLLPFRSPLRTCRTLVLTIQLARAAGQIRAPLGHLLLAARLARLTRRWGVMRVHAHFGTNPASVALLWARLTGAQYSFTAHGPEEFSEPARLALGRKIASARFVAAVTERGAAALRSAAPQHATRVHLVRCGLDQSWLGSQPTPIPDAPLLLCIARLEEQKNPLLLIRAAERLRQLGCRATIRIAGDGALRHQVQSAIDQGSLRSGVVVQLLGWQTQEQIVAQLRNSRALVLSSTAEGLPVAIMEAFALARPVIATDVGGVSELVRPGRNGWLVTPDAPDELAAAMHQALVTPTRILTEMGVMAREDVHAQHDITRSAAELSALFTGETPGMR